MRGGDERGVVIPAEVGASFVVIEPELAFELAVVELDHPPQPGEPRESLRLGAGGEVGDPVVGRRLGAFGPLDDQPFLAGRDAVAGDRVRGGDALEREPRPDSGLASAAERDGLVVGVGECLGVLAGRDRGVVGVVCGGCASGFAGFAVGDGERRARFEDRRVRVDREDVLDPGVKLGARGGCQFFRVS